MIKHLRYFLSPILLLVAIFTVLKGNYYPICFIIFFDIITMAGDLMLKEDESDFNKKRITQELGNLSDENIFKLHEDLFSKSSLIFLDAPKDGYFEEKLIRQLSKINFQERNRYLILDDIRVPEMFEVWRMIDSPKIDATTFGHWRGTGIVNISEGLKIKK